MGRITPEEQDRRHRIAGLVWGIGLALALVWLSIDEMQEQRLHASAVVPTPVARAPEAPDPAEDSEAAEGNEGPAEADPRGLATVAPAPP